MIEGIGAFLYAGLEGIRTVYIMRNSNLNTDYVMPISKQICQFKVKSAKKET